MNSIADAPVADFEDHLERKGNVGRSIDAYRRVLREFQSFVEARDCRVETVTQEECAEWVARLRDKRADATVRAYTGYVYHFYSWLHSTGEIDANPMHEVYQELPESANKDPVRRDITLGEMRAFVGGIGHPLDRAVVITFLKTGIRVGELSNLDIADIQMGGKAPTLTIPEQIIEGEQFRGERRGAANKRNHPTTIPIDAELEHALRKWLCMRPDTRSRARPLFRSTGNEWGKRLSPSMVNSMVTDHAEQNGWYGSGDDPAGNVTPHYFRHFFTTWMRERVGETGSVTYLRGDAIADHDRAYVHNWQDRAQKAYRENIYSVTGGEHS